MAERWEVVIDFSQYKGQNVTIRNKRDVGADEDYNSTDKVMRFIVENSLTDTSDPKGMQTLPATLRNVPFPPTKAVIDRTFKFGRHNGKWDIEGAFWSDGPEARVLAKPERGAVEVWSLQSNSGGWSHPGDPQTSPNSKEIYLLILSPYPPRRFSNHQPDRWREEQRTPLRSNLPQGRRMAEWGRDGQCHRPLCTMGWSLYVPLVSSS